MATAVKLDNDRKGRVAKLADERRRSAQRIMREAIRRYVEREEAREGFRREALASRAEYQAPGRPPTGGEVRQWLGASGGETEAALPACHD